MALFRMREDYLETRIQDFDASMDTSSSSRKRRAGRGKENAVIGANNFVPDASEKFTLKLLSSLYREIKDD